MYSVNSFASRGRGANETATQRLTATASLPLLFAIAVLTATAAVFMLTMVFASANANAFSNTQFDVTVSTTQAAAHPNLNVQLDRQGSESEDIKNAIVDLPPGLLANANAITSKCSSFYFSIDACSAKTQVGSLSVDIVALGLLPLDNVTGGIYLLSPNSTDAATLGMVLRPIGSQIGIINKAYIKNNVTVRTSDQGLKNSHVSLPTTTKAVVLLPVPITINKMNITYQARTGSGNDGNYFMINASSCTPGVATMRLDSYQGVTVYNTDTVTPTGCESVPFDPTFAQTITDKRAEQSTATSVKITEDQTQAAIQRSNLKKATIDFPAGTGLDFAVVNALTACTEAQFLANGCPTTSKIGTANAGIPYLPPNFTGSVYALDLDNKVGFGIALSGPRGIKAKIRGEARVTGIGPAQHVTAVVDNNPQVPLATFTLSFTSKLIQNPATCDAPHVTTAVLEGWNGSVVTKTANYSTTDCAPETSVIVGPGGGPEHRTNDHTPSFTFGAVPAGGTFKCALDGAAFATCTSGITLAALAPLSVGGPDQGYNFRVRACNAIGNCDATPSAFAFVVDRTAPDLAVTSPATGSTVSVADVAVGFTTELDATNVCSVDAGTTMNPCPTGTVFAGLANGSHTIAVTSTDVAGNSQTESTTFEVDVCGAACDAPDTGFNDNVLTLASPRGGLHITDETPSFEFDDVTGTPAAAGFQCNLDGVGWSDCSSPLTLPPQSAGPHSLEVRGYGLASDKAGTADPTPAVASFVESTFNPTIDVAYLDNINNLITNTQAAQHPDINVTLTSTAGDFDYVDFQFPDGFWGSLGAADKCSQIDAAAGTCTAASKIGAIEATAVTNDNVEHTFTSDIYLAEETGDDSLANLVTNTHVVYDGKDYGYIREDAQLGFSVRYDRRPDQFTASVHDPSGLSTRGSDYPTSTSAHPGPDGVAILHLRKLKAHLDGDTGLDKLPPKPLLTAPSSCAPQATSGLFIDQEGHEVTPSVPYQATDCESVPFNPTLVQTYTPVTKGAPTVLDAVATLPDENSTIRNLVVDAPVSIVQNNAGIVSDALCAPADLELLPAPSATCDHSIAGTVDIITPLLPNTLHGVLYLEESGNPLPNVYAYVNEPTLGLDVRVRGSARVTDPPNSHIQLLLNSESDGSFTDLAELPVSSLSIHAGGTAGFGKIMKVSTGCRKIDTTSSAAFTPWSGGPDAVVTQTLMLDPACPN